MKAAQAQKDNLAFSLPYTLSEKPNYDYSAPSTDTKSLTDGVFTKGHFWTQRTTVGWKYKKSITITIDLKKVQSIGTVIFSTAGGTAGAYLPRHLYTFISRDGKDFYYVGDAAEIMDREYGTYRLKKLSLTGISQKARYVSIVAMPEGAFLFCDEIEVLKMGSVQQTNRANSIDHSLADVYKNLIQESSSIANNQPYRQALVEQHKNYILENYTSSLVVNKISPWMDISPLYLPKAASPTIDYDFILPQNSTEYGAFTVTGSNNLVNSISFSIDGGDTKISRLQLYEVPFVVTHNKLSVADPLVPIQSPIKIKPGETKLFWFEISALQKGVNTTKIRVAAKDQLMVLNVHLQVMNVFKPVDSYDLNTNVWAYLYQPMLKSIERQVGIDLQEHHINTVVVPPWNIPTLDMRRNRGFIEYLNNFRNTENILLLVDYAQYVPKDFLSKKWKLSFKYWYNSVRKMLINNGYGASTIYLYPYDEVMEEQNITRFKQLIDWSKKEMPQIKYFATFNNKKAINALLPLVDIGQIYNEADLLNNLPKHRAEIWTYSIAAGGRSQSPYAFYRLKAWRAFANGYAGIGFWNYADKRSEGLNLVDGNVERLAENYAVIYNGSNHTVLSSRRWEAFKLGVEDYQILKAYAAKLGQSEAKQMANEVLKAPNNYNKAGEVRMLMLKQINN